MIDAGSGTSLRFGEAGASMSDLAFIGISHLHTDHSIDLFILIRRGYSSKHDTPLTIAGPSDNDHYVGFSSFVDNFLNSYNYLNHYNIEIKTIDASLLGKALPVSSEGKLFWHASPSKIGQVAQKAQPKLLVLSHFIDLSLNDKSNSLNKVQASYKGPIILANDLVKISL